MRNSCRFFLKVRNRGTFLKQAGTRDTGEGETHPAAETTRRLFEAQGFQTRRQAERMRDLLYDRYGIKTDIIRYDGGRRYEA
jgi:hypothetical protein